MDFVTIATGIYTVLSPFVAKGVEKIIDKASEEGWTERKAVWDWVKGALTKDDDELISIFKEAETDEKAQGKLEGKIETHLESNLEKAKEIETLLNTIKEIEKKNKSTLINEDIKGNSKVENIVEQATGSSANNDSSVTNKNIDNSTVINRVIQK